MAAVPADAIRQIEYYATALKAPRIRDSAARLADQARDAGWTHEQGCGNHARGRRRGTGSSPTQTP
jgi:hypothetical protein